MLETTVRLSFITGSTRREVFLPGSEVAKAMGLGMP
jgi:hypothetical protein